MDPELGKLNRENMMLEDLSLRSRKCVIIVYKNKFS
jgi:hypothetical protein